ncbi:hypothetical protein FRC02_001521 [Tulasnella sp. 418]|nr:hypothetical protein FRC02_001521 [Tulasnella sp. 418]
MSDRNKNNKKGQRQKAKQQAALLQQSPQRQTEQDAVHVRPLRHSVEELARAAYDDLLPGAVGVYFDYGFINTKTETEAINLGGLYQGLIKHLGCSLKELHQACMENRLAEFIQNEFTTKIPPRSWQSRGDYYQWFERNTDIVKNNHPFPSPQTDLQDCLEIDNDRLHESLPYFPGPPLPLPMSRVLGLSDSDVLTLPTKDLVFTLKSLKDIVSVDPRKTNEELRVEFENMLKELRDKGNNRCAGTNTHINPPPLNIKTSRKGVEEEVRRKLDDMKLEDGNGEEESGRHTQLVTADPDQDIGPEISSSNQAATKSDRNKRKKKRQREKAKQRALEQQSGKHQEISQAKDDTRPLRRSVEDLARAAYSDMFPGAIGVYFDYGVINTKTDAEAVYLLGTYQGLIKNLQCDLDELHEACIENRLAEFVQQEFTTKLPDKATRGGYYPWFEQNTHIVKNSNPFPSVRNPDLKGSRRELPPPLPYFPGPPVSIPMFIVRKLSDMDIQELPSKDLVSTLKSLKGLVTVDPRKTSAELRVEFEEMLRALRDERIEINRIKA